MQNWSITMQLVLPSQFFLMLEKATILLLYLMIIIQFR